MNQQHRFIFWGVLLIVVLLSVSSITFPIFVAQTVKNQNVICIDAGHGGSDPGKVGNSNILEKDINLSLALKLQKLLEKKNYKVYMTRNGDYNLADSKENEKRSDLSNRKQLIFENDPMAVISIHQNSYTDSSVKGAQVFYYTDSKEGEKLALCMQAALVAGLDPANHRKAKGNKTYYMLKKTDAVLVICECGFLSNPEEEALLNTKEYQKKVADALCDGVLTYLGEKKNGKEKTQTKTEETAAGAASAYACPAGGLSGIRRI